MLARREDVREVEGWFRGSVRHQAIQEQEQPDMTCGGYRTH